MRPRDNHPLEIHQGHQSSDLAIKGRGRVVEPDFAEVGSTLKEVEKVYGREFAVPRATDCEGREVGHVPPR